MRKEELVQLESSLRKLNEKVIYLSDEYMAIQKILYITINLCLKDNLPYIWPTKEE